MTNVWVDTRWEGRHGIGRYAHEVCSRLTLPWRALPVRGAPASPKGAFAKVPEGLLYSPGYNAFARATRQVLTLHDLIHLEVPWPGRARYLAYYNAIIKPVVRRSGTVVTVSETSKRAIAAWLGDPTIEIVNAGIGASPMFHREVSPAEARQPYLMYVGNLRKHKNITVVLDAMARVPSAHMRMLIPARERGEAKRLFTERGICDRVDLLESVSDEILASHYRGAAATVMPSTIEGFGLPALESIMTGTPVLYWRGCSAVAETVAHRGHAVNEPYDSDEWGDVIEHAIAKPHSIEPPTHAYDWDLTATKVNDVLATRAQA